GRKMLTNASYFAFTATPKNKTLEMFGVAVPTADGTVKHYPFHNYSMKQAIQEGFILDVLKFYTPIQSYYKLAKTVLDDPRFDKEKAQKKLRKFVESNDYAINQKADIIVEHFHEQVIAKGKIGGKARAMVVTGGIERAIEYYHAIRRCLEARKSPYKAIIAFSGDKEYGGETLNEAGVNGFPSNAIEKTFRIDPYRFLVVADKFQTGYDEPLLHTMYVDKILTDIKAVQTLSRLNRAHPRKLDTFVLDFANEAEDIQKAFSLYYRTTILSGETDPNKLYDLIAAMEAHQIYTQHHVDSFVELYLTGAERDKLDPILDVCANLYKALDENAQVEFKASAKGFVRTYGFLGAILPYGNPEWEKLSIFMNLLLPKLPSPTEEDLSQGILDAIDLDSYRAEAKAQMAIQLEDSDAETEPVPTGSIGGKSDPELDLLSNILTTFNDLFGNIDWKDADNTRRQVAMIPAMVSKDQTYRNAMRNADKQEARTESDRVLQSVIVSIMSDNMELFKQFNDNPAFKKWLSDMVFMTTYNTEGKPIESASPLG
ncbi:MAG: type I restriction endonuclease subunit R, partial [Synergistaceae bacterium]|nr:type I restriction endonuclease subunit R [Synergistaceae bacterium]